MSEDTGTATVRAPVRRLFYVDNLRVALTVLVVLHHCAVTYSDIPLWYYTEASRDPSSIALDVFIVVNQAFFMGFFFLVSGFFTPGAVDRKGPGRFAADRLVRLGIPLLLFVLVLRTILTLPGWAASGLPYWSYWLATWDPGPTWFLEVLLAFASGYALVRRFGPARAPRAATAPSGRAIAAFVAGLIVVTFGWRLVVPSGTYVPGLGLPSADYLPQYLAMFVVGLLAFRRGWFASLSRRAGRTGFVAAGVSLVVLVPLYLGTTGLLQSLVSDVFQATFATGLIIGLLVWFREHVDRQGARAAFLSQNAFAVYVTHPLVVTALGYALGWLPAPAIAKFAILAVLAVPLCWLLAAALRSVPRVRSVL